MSDSRGSVITGTSLESDSMKESTVNYILIGLGLSTVAGTAFALYKSSETVEALEEQSKTLTIEDGKYQGVELQTGFELAGNKKLDSFDSGSKGIYWLLGAAALGGLGYGVYRATK